VYEFFYYSEGITIRKILAAITVLAVVTAIVLHMKTSRTVSDFSESFFALDTIVSVKMSEDLKKQTKDEILRYNDIFDMYSETSELYELNRQKKLACSEPLQDIISRTLDLNGIYGYDLDITSGNLSLLWHESLENGLVPDGNEIKKCIASAGTENIKTENGTVTLDNSISVDLGSVAKGYILDRLFPVISEKDPEYALVSFGSSTLLYSSSPDRVFNVIIRSGSSGSAGTVRVKGTCFVSTSGDYERYTEVNGVKYHHITDMKTGYPSDSGLSSVTVFCQNGLLSDFLSTLIFIGGKNDIGKYLEADEFKLIATDEEGNIFKSSSLEFIPS